MTDLPNEDPTGVIDADGGDTVAEDVAAAGGKPIVIADTVTKEQILTLLRQVLLILGPLIAFMGLAETSWVVDLRNFLANEVVLSAIAGLVVTVTVIFGQWKTRREHAKLKVMEPFTPAAVAVLKSNTEA